MQQVQTQAQNQEVAKAVVVADEKAPEELDGKAKTSFEEILLGIPATIEKEEGEVDMLDAPASPLAETASTPSPTEVSVKKPTLDDLLESAKRRKRRSSGAPPSPLASNPPDADVELGGRASEGTASHSLQKALDDFELDVKKGLGRASELFRWGRRRSKGDEDAGR